MSRVREMNNGKLSALNSTSVVLAAGATFTGVAEDVSEFVEVRVAVKSDQSSAADGLHFEFSTDGVNWDHVDEYAVPANTGKNYVVQRVAQFFRIIYTNGTTIQTSFRLSSIFNRVAGVPSSHRTNNDITSEDDAVLNVSILKTVGSDPATFHTVDSQHPMPADGDSLYLKDIDVSNSDNGGFSGVVTDYFDSLKTVNNDATATNPKVIKIWLNRSMQTNSIGFGCDDLTKSFSNIKIEFLGSGEEVRYTKDLSADSTKRNSYVIKLPPLALNGMRISFLTADEIGLSNIILWKTNDVNSRIQAVDDTGTVVDIGASTAGNLKVTDAENGLAIAKGEVPGSTFIHKFGVAPDFDTVDLQVTVWDGANDGLANAMNYTYSATNNITQISSSAADTVDIEIQGLDTNYDLVTQTITLTGLTPAPLSTALIRVFRMTNVGATDLVGTVYAYITGATVVLGVPTIAAEIRAIISIGNNQTLMAVYTVPNGFTGYMRDFFASTAGGGKNSNYIIRLKARPFGQVFQVKNVAAISDLATSILKSDYVEPEIFAAKTDIEITALMIENTTGAAISAGFDIVLVAD